jgi:hypothetical protein
MEQWMQLFTLKSRRSAEARKTGVLLVLESGVKSMTFDLHAKVIEVESGLPLDAF